ncbi:MAG: nucleotidyltransferase domain-containing protein [Candidatus Nanohaloarchaea archaeon]
MDTETIERVKTVIQQVAAEESMELAELVVFGSRVRDDYRADSDVDILIVSPAFDGVPWNKRPGPFYEAWDYDTLPTPEFICLTPDEFAEKKERQPHIVRTAVENGVSLA